LKGGFDAFVAKLSPTGQIIYSTYLGGSLDDAANSLVIDASGNTYITGFTQSKDFPATLGTYMGGMDVFVARLDAGGQLSEATFYGGSGDDSGNAVALSALGTVTVTGSTSSSDLPVTPDASQSKLIPGQVNGFRMGLGLAAEDLSVNIPAPLGPINSSSYRPTPGLAITGTETVPVSAASGARASGTFPDIAAAERVSIFVYFETTDFEVYSSDDNGCPAGYYRIVPYDRFSDIRYDRLHLHETTEENPPVCVPATEINDLDKLKKSIQNEFPELLRAVGWNPGIGRSSNSESRAVANPMHAFVFGATLSDGPDISPGGIVNAASFVEGPIVPGEIITIFGANIGPSTLAGATLKSANLLDTTTGGTQVLFDGVPSPMVYSEAGQVSAVVPYGVAGQTKTLVAVTYQGLLAMTAAAAPVAASNPAIFTASGGTGQAALQNADGSYNSPANRAARGSIVVLYATGEGQTNPAGVDGMLSTNPGPQPLLPVSVTIGGLSAEIVYYGGAPGLVAGLMQVNALVPKGVTPGPAVPIVLTVGTASSQAGVTLAVR
jgi:uncharacterized protein (TIGR03437 family)